MSTFVLLLAFQSPKLRVSRRFGNSIIWRIGQKMFPFSSLPSVADGHSRNNDIFGRNQICTANQKGLLQIYEDLVKANTIELDQRQRSLAKGLTELQKTLHNYKPWHVRQSHLADYSRGPLGKLSNSAPRPRPGVSFARIPRGIYIWGDVGTGKTMLLDLFYGTCPLPSQRKRRVHFHSFMLEVHKRIHEWKKKDLELHGRSRHIDLRPERDAIKQVAKMISKEAWVLCFDEFQVTDIADAIIMTRLFGELFSRGTVLVATSNRPPRDLYKDGLNRHDFLPFIDSLKEQCVIFSMKSSTDYRLLVKAEHAQGQYLWPANAQAKKEVDSFYENLAHSSKQEEVTIQVMMGRKLTCPHVIGDVCRFTFSELCDRELGAADYRALCENFSALVLEDIPALALKDHNQARRFITLIDEVYEHGTSLVCTAELPPEKLFRGGRMLNHTNPSEPDSDVNDVGALDAAQEITLKEGELESVRELDFAFKRAASRIVELCMISRSP